MSMRVIPYEGLHRRLQLVTLQSGFRHIAKGFNKIEVIQKSLERAKGIEQRSPGAAKDLNIGS